MRTWIALPILALLIAGCGSSSLVSRGDDGDTTTEELKRRVLELQRQTTVHELEIERLQRRLAELEGQRPRPAEVERPARALPPVREIPVETIESPSIEESDLEAVSLGKPEPSPVAERPPAGAASPRSPTEGSGPRAEAPAATAALITPEEQRAYDRGYTLYHQGRYLDAEGELLGFQRRYPESTLADNAQYWIGECRYARKDIEGALAAFRETVERFPGGNKVPDALLKAGQCFEALEDRNGAAATYREVMDRYPTSSAAARARDRLQALE